MTRVYLLMVSDKSEYENVGNFVLDVYASEATAKRACRRIENALTRHERNVAEWLALDTIEDVPHPPVAARAALALTPNAGVYVAPMKVKP